MKMDTTGIFLVVAVFDNKPMSRRFARNRSQILEKPAHDPGRGVFDEGAPPIIYGKRNEVNGGVADGSGGVEPTRFAKIIKLTKKTAAP